MKRFLLMVTAIVVGCHASAQPWLEKYNGKRVTLQQIEEDYRTELVNRPGAEEEEEEEGFEGKDYHFERWLNYWKGRTDDQGYLVSPRKHWLELKKQQAEYNNRSLAKGTARDANWTFYGPVDAFEANKGLGRINVVEFHPTDDKTFMIGSPGGGLWRTTDEGATWAPLNDFFPVLGISDIDYNPKNPNTIYVCTGDRDANDTYSMGVFKSVDGGTTWDTTGFQYGFAVTQQTTGLVINPADTNMLVLATTTGIHKSYDAGKSWSLKQAGSFKQILYHPTNSGIIYAAQSSSIYYTTDAGDTWQKGADIPGAKRIEMAVTPASDQIIKIVAVKSDNGLLGIYQSNDTAKTFTPLLVDNSSCDNNILASSSKGDKCGGQGWYDLTIAISPLNANQVVVGGVNTWYSTDGGYNWTVANQWTKTVPGVTLVHADKHYHKFHPLNPSVLFECNDGGIYKTASPMSSNGLWDNLSDGLGITQYYRNGVADIASFVLGGAQDNGSRMLMNGTSTFLTGGDGMDCHIDPVDSNILYTSVQNGELKRSTNGGKNFTDIQNNIPGKPTGAWITPLAIHPLSSNLLLTGYDKVYMSDDYGDSWSAMSPSFGTHIDRLALTANNPDYVYAMIATPTSHSIKYSTDFGAKWNALKSNGSVSCTDILVDPVSPDTLWATFKSYTGNKVALMDIKENLTWKTFNIGIPEVPVNCIAFDSMNRTFYIGTDLGVYYKEEHEVYWTYFNNQTLPNVEVMDLGINLTTQTLWAATYGRGMWSSPLHKSTLGVANTIPLAKDVITIAPNPNHGSFTIATTNSLIRGTASDIRIVNMMGSVVWQKQVAINNDGKATMNIDLPRGTYIVELIKESVVFAKERMIVN